MTDGTRCSPNLRQTAKSFCHSTVNDTKIWPFIQEIYLLMTITMITNKNTA